MMSNRIEKTEDKLEIKPFTGIKAERLSWLWPDKIPLGSLSLLVGNGGIGKTFLTLYMAAQVSTGRLWPNVADKAKKGSVIILTAEDNLSVTVKPRLMAAEADMSRIFVLKQKVTLRNTETGQTTSNESDVYNLTNQIDKLKEAVYSMDDLRLVIVDPITAYMEGKDSNNNSEVREFLRPLSDLASERNISIVGINHFNKNQDMAAIHRSLGSVGFTNAVRAVWYVLLDPENPDRKLFVPSKQNLSKNNTGWAFRLIERNLFIDGDTVQIPYCAFDTEVIYQDVESLMSPKQPKGRPAKQNDAEEWLYAHLSNGPKKASDVYNAGRAAGYSDRLMQNAKKKLGLQAVRNTDGNMGEGWWEWALPTY